MREKEQPSPCKPSQENASKIDSPTINSGVLSAGNYPVNKRQIFFVVIVCLSSILCGTMNGWTTVLPRLQNDTSRFTISDEEVSWLVSMTPLIMMVVSVAAGVLMEAIGPTHLMQLSIALNLGSWLIVAFTPYKWLLYAGRAIGAIAFSFLNTLLQPLTAEMSSTQIRGLASSGPEVLGTFGFLLGSTLAACFEWNVATALLAIPPLTLLIPSIFVPESPYWLVRRGRLEDARGALRKLAGPKADVEREIAALTNAPTATQTSIKKQFEELKKGRNFRPLLLLLSIFVFRDLGGRAPIFQYAVYIFLKAGVNLDPFTCTVILGVVRLFCVCVSAAVLDRVGRRPLLLGAALVGGLSLCLVGLFLYLELTAASWLLLVCLMIYVGCYGLGLGPIPWVYVGELLPSPVRSLGSSTLIFTGTLTIFGVNFAFLWVIRSVGLGVTLLCFSMSNFFVFLIVWRWVPETRGASLQELEQAFSSRTKNSGKLTQVVVCEEKTNINKKSGTKEENGGAKENDNERLMSKPFPKSNCDESNEKFIYKL